MVDGRERDEAEGVADGDGVSSDDSMRDWEETLRVLRELKQSTASDEADAARMELQALHTVREIGTNLREIERDNAELKEEFQEMERVLHEIKRNSQELDQMIRETEQMMRESERDTAGIKADLGESKRVLREIDSTRKEIVEQAHIDQKEAGKQAYIKRKVASKPTRIERQYAAKQAHIEWQEHAEEVRWESWRVRSKVYSRDGGHCRYCGVKLDRDGEWHVDHIEPVYRGGGSEMENLALACVDCNLSKMARPPANFLAEMGRGSLAAFLDEPRQRAARDTRNAMIGTGCAFAAGIMMFIIVVIAANGDARFVGGFFAALAAFVITLIVATLVFQGPRCTTCSAPPVEGASLCGAHLAAQRRARIGPKRRPRRTDRRG